MIDRQNDLRTHDNSQKLATGWGDEYTAGCLVDYSYFKKYFKMIKTETLRLMDIDSMSILCQYIEKKISTNSHVILTYFVDVISMGKKPTSLRRTFFNTISMAKNRLCL